MNQIAFKNESNQGDYDSFGRELLEAKKIVDRLSVPPSPDALFALNAELNSRNPEMRSISQIISSDPGLGSTVLQVVNAPVFCLDHKITSISKAVFLLGLNRLRRLKPILRNKLFDVEEQNFNRFWDSSKEIAFLTREIAAYVGNVDLDDAYIVGLLHESGVSIMMQAFDNYKETLQRTPKKGDTITHIENEHHGLNRCTVGAMLCKEWFLPEQITKAVLHQNNYSLFAENSRHTDIKEEPYLLLIAIVKMAKHISDVNRRYFRTSNVETREWDLYGHHMLRYLGLTLEEFDDIESELIDILQAPCAA